MFVAFVKGYRAITRENINPISNEDKYIYMLAMGQTLALTLYYFLFEEFFVLATIRNLLIWISINILDLLCKIYWIKEQEANRKIEVGITALKVFNFLAWFVIAVGHGSSLVNTNFELGYNCRVLDWTFLSGVLVIITACEGFVAFQIVDRLGWEAEQPGTKDDKVKVGLILDQKQDITLIAAGSMAAAVIMFIWDYLAFSVAESDE
jgi:hypothetical protein